jgi:hypothetical protein
MKRRAAGARARRRDSAIRAALIQGEGEMGRIQWSDVAERFHQFICGLRGHNAVLHFDPHRLSLVCTNCRWHSPGVVLTQGHFERSGRPATVVHRGPAPVRHLRRVA